MSRQDDIKKLIVEHNRRLQKRQEQQARLGVNTPPEILIEIEDIEAEIEKLQTELTEIESRVAASPLNTRNWSQTTKVVLGLGLFVLIVGLAVGLTWFIAGAIPRATPVSMTLTPTPTSVTPTTAPTPTPVTLTPTPTPTPVPPTLTPTPVTPTSTSTPTPTPTARPITSQPASLHRYIVKADDTILTIARLFYGDSTQWQKIHAANKQTLGGDPLFGEPPGIRTGQVLNLPDLPPTFLHIVEEGDRLERIASLYYGVSYRNLQDLIYEENKKTIGYDPDRINPGQELNIPRLEPLTAREFLVREGDTLEEIARAFYNQPGPGTLLIYEYEPNKKLIGDNPNFLPEGLVLVLPASDPPVPERDYFVKAGDTLQIIANSCFGFEDAINKINDISLANRPVIGYDPNFLKPGQKLTLYGCTQ